MTKINIEELTLGEIKQLTSLFSNNNSKQHPFQIGKSYFIRTVTMILVGKLEKVFDSELVLSTASWVADAGIISEAMRSGLEALSSTEIEPFVNDVIVGRGSLIDMTEYNFPLPTLKK